MIPEQDINQWILFFQERWWLILIAIVVLLIIISMVKTVLKWLLVIAIVAALALYGANYTEELTALGDKVMAEAKEQAFQAIVSGAANAKYEPAEDGSYVISTDRVRVEGVEGENEVTLFWNDVRIGTFKIDATIEAFLEEAKRSS